MSATTTADKQPDLTGRFGKAWRQDIAAIKGRYPDGPPAECTPASWIVTAPYAHPFWHSYWLALISLDETIPGAPPVEHRYLDGATHELWLYALDPDKPMPLDDRVSYLTPMNFGAQLVAASDTEARRRIEQTVQDIIDGRLNPDTDFRRHWIERFGDNMVRGRAR